MISVYRKQLMIALWRGMLYRCENPLCARYHRYGGRGIKVCDEWHDFEKFLEDMGPKPAGKTLDRKDNDGDYTPENCRWATHTQQANNRSEQKRYVVNGLEGTLTELCDVLGLSTATVRDRFGSGWSIENAFRPGRFNGQKGMRKLKSSSC